MGNSMAGRTATDGGSCSNACGSASSSPRSTYSSASLSSTEVVHIEPVKYTTKSGGSSGSSAGARHEGFVKRKGGKRPPRDPSMSVQERLAQAMAEQKKENSAPNAQQAPPPLVSTSPATLGRVGGLVDLANRVSVPMEPRATRRLRPKLPSSTHSPVGSESSVASRSSGESAREPVELRSFELLKVLGKGSHGKVFLVRHRDSKRLFAMKQLKKVDVIRSKQLENTKREFRVHTMLASQDALCPNIAPLRYAFHSRSRLYMVFDYCSGGELYFHIGQRGRLPEVLARFYAAQIALAIGYLHSMGVAYRDLKPENLLLDSEGNINLVDLGLCKDGMRSATSGSKSFCGTTEYLAPEILRYQEHGLAVDWWAFGMVLFEMLTGLPPWYSYQQEEVVEGILHGDLEFPSYVSPEAQDLVSRLLDRNPATRIGSSNDVEDMLDHPFFEGVDWAALVQRNAKPPFRPPDDGLACNFDAEFTEARVEAERDYLPPTSQDPFKGFYFDCEDPINCEAANEPTRNVA